MQKCEGFLNLNKPVGCSSRNLVDLVCRELKIKKVGHAGTLDPLASGVLVIAVGQATKYIQYAQQGAKRYLARFRFGCFSETDDIEGEVQQVECPLTPTEEEFTESLKPFLGEINQIPPAFSAKKVNGRRAYKLARRGVEVELKPARVVVHQLCVVEWSWPEVVLDIQCGHGTYIRSLGRDIARALETSAVMTELQRTAVGPFLLENALSLDQKVTQQGELATGLLPLDAPFQDFSELLLSEEFVTRIRHGQRIWVNDFAEPPAMIRGATFVLRENRTRKFIGLGEWTEDACLQPRALIAQER